MLFFKSVLFFGVGVFRPGEPAQSVSIATGCILA